MLVMAKPVIELVTLGIENKVPDKYPAVILVA